MNNGLKSGRMDAKGRAGEKLDYCRPDDRDPVNVLLDISEETAANDQDPYQHNNHTGREQCIRGWGRCPPFSCLFLAQQKSRKAKPEVPDSHCLLCADLKSLKLSEQAAEEPWKNNVAPPWEFHSRTPSTISSSSSTEEELSDFTLQERSGVTGHLANNVLVGGELCQQNKTLHPLHPNGPWLLLTDRNAGKVALAGSRVALPPVRGNPKRPDVPNLSSREEEEGPVSACGATRPATIDKAAVDGDSYSGLILEAARGSLTSTQGSVLSDLTTPASWRVQMPVDPLPRDTLPIARRVRRELIRSPPRHNSWQRQNLGLRSRTLRREEPELPMLLGTRVQIPVSTHRLL